MATTTNYGWTTPDDTALVKDGAAAIRTLGSSVDTTTKNLNPSTTLGDIEYRSSTANTNTRLGIGGTGTVLTVAGGVPTWAAAAGGGKLKQVVEATSSTYFATSSGSYVDVTSMTASITPTANDSKILIFCQASDFYIESGQVSLGLQFLRTSTVIQEFVNQKVYSGETTTGNWLGYFLDSPATTSATTYKLQMKNTTAGGGTSYWNYNGSATRKASFMLMEIGA
jgi:hypothetical protein